MEKKQLVLDYIAAVEKQIEVEERFNDALQHITDGHTVYDPITYEYSSVFDKAMIMAVGQEAFDWVLWYLWDRPLLPVDPKTNVEIDGVEYHIETPQQLVDICIKW